MVTVHHLNNSRSQRILWLLEDGVDYTVKRYERDSKTMLAPPELRAIHPLGKSPVITDTDGTTVAESGAIVEYLVDRYGNGRMIPASGTPDRLRYTYWLHYAEGSAMPPLLLKLVFNRVADAPMPFFIKPIARAIAGKALTSFIEPQIQLHLNYMEGELGKSAWFAGNEFTAADVQMSFPLEAAAARGGLDRKYGKLTAFLERVHARPAYQKALAKGGKYELMS